MQLAPTGRSNLCDVTAWAATKPGSTTMRTKLFDIWTPTNAWPPRKTIQIRPNWVIVWPTPCINNGPWDQNSSGKQIENRKLSKNFLFFPACDNQGENCKKNLLFESQKKCLSGHFSSWVKGKFSSYLTYCWVKVLSHKKWKKQLAISSLSSLQITANCRAVYMTPAIIIMIITLMTWSNCFEWFLVPIRI